MSFSLTPKRTKRGDVSCVHVHQVFINYFFTLLPGLYKVKNYIVNGTVVTSFTKHRSLKVEKYRYFFLMLQQWGDFRVIHPSRLWSVKKSDFSNKKSLCIPQKWWQPCHKPNFYRFNIFYGTVVTSITKHREEFVEIYHFSIWIDIYIILLFT